MNGGVNDDNDDGPETPKTPINKKNKRKAINSKSPATPSTQVDNARTLGSGKRRIRHDKGSEDDAEIELTEEEVKDVPSVKRVRKSPTKIKAEADGGEDDEDGLDEA